MRLARPSAGPPRDPIVPLIDIVFFLLVFFLLVGRFDVTSPFDRQPARASSGDDLAAGGAQVHLAEDGRIALGDELLGLSDLAARLRAQVRQQPDLRVSVHADGRARTGAVLPLLAELEAAGIGDVVLVVEAGDP